MTELTDTLDTRSTCFCVQCHAVKTYTIYNTRNSSEKKEGIDQVTRIEEDNNLDNKYLCYKICGIGFLLVMRSMFF